MARSDIMAELKPTGLTRATAGPVGLFEQIRERHPHGVSEPSHLEPHTLVQDPTPAKHGSPPSSLHTQEGKATLNATQSSGLTHRWHLRCSLKAFQKCLGSFCVVVSLSPALCTCPPGLPPGKSLGHVTPTFNSCVSSQAHPQRPTQNPEEPGISPHAGASFRPRYQLHLPASQTFPSEGHRKPGQGWMQRYHGSHLTKMERKEQRGVISPEAPLLNQGLYPLTSHSPTWWGLRMWPISGHSVHTGSQGT